jgi:hypothetical protein
MPEIARIPGVFYFDNPKFPAEHGWYVPQNLIKMGTRGTVLEDYEPDRQATTPSGLELLDHQLRSVSFLRDMSASDEGKLLGATAGLGKDQPVDTLICTPTGWKRIGDMSVGDYAIDSNGKATKITGVFPQGKKPVYKISLSDGSSVLAGEEHLWTVSYRTGRGRTHRKREITVTTKQLLDRPKIPHEGVQGRIHVTDLSKHPIYFPMLSSPIEFEAKELPVAPYLMGQLIANGSLSWGTATLASGTRDWSELRELIELEGNKPSSVRTYGSTTQATFSNIIAKIRELGLAVGSRDKFIPRIYLEGTPAQRFSLLRGLMDGDGSISRERCRITYHTTSSHLAHDVVELVQSFGGASSVRTYDRMSEGKPVEYQVRIRMPVGFCPFAISRKSERYRPGIHAAPVRTLMDVEYVGEMETVCISVDATDQLYLTENCILTHNTNTTLQALWLDGMLEKPGLIVGPLKCISSWVGPNADPARHFSMTVQPLEGKGAPDVSILQRHRFFFIHYEIADAWSAWLFQVLNPAWIIFDESHQCINKSKYSLAAFHLSSCQAERRYLLSGTPVPKLRYHLFWQLAIAQPRQWDTRPHKYGVRYCAGQQAAEEEGAYWSYEGESNDREYQARLAGLFIRYTQEQIQDQMPSPKRTVIPVQLPDDVLTEYKEAELRPIQYLKSKGLTKQGGTFRIGDMIVKLTQKDVKPQAMRIRCITLLINILAAAKRQAALHAISEWWARHDKIVIFTWRRESAKWISDKMREAIKTWNREDLYRVYGPIHGGMPHEKRLEKADEFAQDAHKCIFVATRGACGMSMNELRFATAVINVSLDYTTTNITQGDARVYRMGNPALDRVELGYLKADRTIDDHIIEIMTKKALAAHKVSSRDEEGYKLMQDLSPSVEDGQTTIDTLCNLLGMFKDIEQGFDL